MPLFKLEVTETVSRLRIYIVEADSPEEAEEMAERGDTEEELPRGDDFKDEILRRSPGPAFRLPDCPVTVSVPLCMRADGWLLLRHQKYALLEAVSRGGIDAQVGEGLLGLIDEIQDYAVDVCGVPKELVFPPAEPDEDDD
jgi:hypothetical protein